jgi:hypothetical protein
VVLVERKGSAKEHCTLNHEIGTVPTDTTVSDESQDALVRALVGLVLGDYLSLFAFEYSDAGVVLFDVKDEVVELPYRTFALPGTVLLFLGAVVEDVVEVGDLLRT